MKVEELPTELEAVVQKVESQQAYVDKLVAQVNEGATEIKVFDDANQVWTMIPLTDWNTTQHAKLVALMTYQGSLSGIYTQLQALLDEALKGVVVPA